MLLFWKTMRNEIYPSLLKDHTPCTVCNGARIIVVVVTAKDFEIDNAKTLLER